MLNLFLNYVVDRLKERSTWAGLSLLLAGVGVHFKPDHMVQIVEVGSDLVGAIFMLTQDPKPVVQVVPEIAKAG